MHKVLPFLLLSFLLIGCGNAQPTASPEARAYLDEVFQLLQTNSVRRKSIDWPAFRQKVLLHARNAQTVEDTYPSVQYAIQELGDGHSYFKPAKEHPASNTTEDGPPPPLPNETVPDDIGYVRVRYCMGNTDAATAYRDELLNDIRQQDKPHIKGWIVDLRGNFGGNMAPMLAGLSPLLGEGIVGYFVDPDHHAEPWILQDGRIYSGSALLDSLPHTYTLRKKAPYIAVLTDTSTASSGEAVAVAFKGRAKTRSFGLPTYGVSTGNQSHTLSDGSRINLTELVFADRNKILYGKSIHPDRVCTPEDALMEAIHWLRVQP